MFEKKTIRWLWRAGHLLHIFLMLVCLGDLYVGLPCFSYSLMTNQMMRSQMLLHMQLIHCIFKCNTHAFDIVKLVVIVELDFMVLVD